MGDDAKFIKCQGANLTNGFAGTVDKFVIKTFQEILIQLNTT